MKKIYLSLLITTLALTSKAQSSTPSSENPSTNITIERFDKALFHLISSDNKAHEAQLTMQYPAMLDLLGKGVLNIPSHTQEGYFDKAINYFSEPTLLKLYNDAITLHANLKDQENELSQALAIALKLMPHLQAPAMIYAHVSGLSQNVLTAEGIISLSIDKYLGEAYPLYQDYFYPTQLRKMQQKYIAPDYLQGWIMSEHPFLGNQSILLDRMTYEGIIKYALTQAFPHKSEAEILALTPQEQKWCTENEEEIWKYIIQHKHLFTSNDPHTTDRYMSDLPCTFLNPSAPSNLGGWIGLQIVKAYFNNNATSIPSAFGITSQQLLSASQYNP